MDVSTLENATDWSIRKDLGISKRIPEARIEATEVIPELKDLSKKHERRRLEGVRDESPPTEIQGFAAIIVVC